ncbi:MAG: ABC transporter permease [Oscillospiraceae bacterium]|nr:ABC transporter permease [Oscillospiraceae bacterium]
MKQKSRNLRPDSGLDTVLSSVLCVLAGLLIGFVILLLIEPGAAVDGISDILLAYFRMPGKLMFKYLGQTLVRGIPLLLCALSVILAQKAGVFNIGVAGQYTGAACICLYSALAWKLPWYACVLLAIAVGAAIGALPGILKLYRNVNVVVSGIMINWITLYLSNWILDRVKQLSGPDTLSIQGTNASALLPKMGLDKLFSGEKTVTIALPVGILVAVGIWVLLNKTVFGYELRAAGNSPAAARYAGMKEKRILLQTLMISGALAGLGAACLYLSGIENWKTTSTVLPAVGFSSIAVAFLGGLDPLGAIASSFFIQHITMGGGDLDLRYYSPQITELISGLIIYLCAFAGCFKLWLRERRRRQTTDNRREQA